MKSFYVVLVPVLFAAGAHADVLSQTQSLLGSSSPEFDPSSLQSEVSLENPAYAPFSSADSDIGVQQVLGEYKGLPPVSVTFDLSFNYTDNAPGEFPNLTEESWFLASRLAAVWRPRLAFGWFADVGLSQDLYRFEGKNAADFENFEPFIGFVKSIPELDDLIFYTRYEYQRITGGSLSDSNYSAQRVRTGFQKELLLAPRYQLSAGINAAWDIEANPDSQERNSYTADLSYTYWLADALSATLSWSGSIWDFDAPSDPIAPNSQSREDWSQLVGLELTWTPHRNVVVYTNIFYTNLNSNAPNGQNDFESWQTGIGMGLNLTF